MKNQIQDEKLIPLKQGLKPVVDGPFAGHTYRDEKLIPLKQGLKLR